MSWNHRVIRFEERGEPYYQIHECHYSAPGDTVPTSWTAEPIAVLSDSRLGLCWVLGRMVEAVSKPVLAVTPDNKLVEIEA